MINYINKKFNKISNKKIYNNLECIFNNQKILNKKN